MIKRFLSVALAIAVTATITTNAYASDDVLNSISAGAAKKVSVSQDSGSGASSKGMVAVSENKGKKSDTNKQGSATKVKSGSSKAEESKSLDSNKADNNVSETKSTNSYELCIADVEDSMNVRAEASEESAVVGYLYKDCVGEIIERKDGWTRIRSGILDGWAKDDYLLFGDDAKKKTDGALMEVAVINADKLRVRAEASEDAEVKEMLLFGDEVEILDKGDEWTKVSFEDGTEGEDTGYVSNDYITVKSSYKSGETIDQVKDREEKSKVAKEEAEKKDKEEKKDDSEPDESEKATEPVKAAEAEVKEESSDKNESEVTNNGAVSASVDDETLLAALIQCECNGNYDAQLAVGAVVVNRAKSGYGSISNAIYAPYQFGPASSGKLALTLSTGAISASARQAAHDAISGLSNVGNARYFRNVSSGHAGIVIGNHVYW